MKLLLYIPPVGLNNKNWQPTIEFLPDDPMIDLYSVTRGEGQALLFDMTDFDLSNNFREAILNGDFLEKYGRVKFKITVA